MRFLTKSVAAAALVAACALGACDAAEDAPDARTSAFDYFAAQSDATTIPGLGDRAIWATLNEMTGYVVVITGSRAIVVAVAEADGLDPASRRHAEALARLMLAGS